MVVGQPITDPIAGPSFDCTFTFGPELDNFHHRLITLTLWLFSVRSGWGLNWIKIVLNLFQLFFGDLFHCVGAKPFHINILPVIVNDPEFIKRNLVFERYN